MRSKFLAGIALASFGLTASSLVAAQGVRFSEIHYDNVSTDSGEAIEVSGPAGTDVTGWTIVLYNGNGGVTYTPTVTLNGPIPATCGSRGVIASFYPVNGIQNGSPDGMALVDASGAVVEFLSYEGGMTATNGPAAGRAAIDILVSEPDNTPVGQSLARRPDGTWAPPAPSSFGACNDDGGTPPADVASITVTPANPNVNVGATLALTAAGFDAGGQPVAGATFTWSSSATAVANVNSSGLVTGVSAGDALITATAANGVAGSTLVHVNSGPPQSTSPVRFNEIHYDNAGVDADEAIEVEGPAGTDLTGYSIVLYNGSNGAVYDTQALSGVLPASCGARGVAFVTYPHDGVAIQNGGPDGFALIDNTGALVEFLSYEGVMTANGGPANGALSVDIGAAQDSAAVGTSLQRNSSGVWKSNARSFGACNTDVSTPVGNSIFITGRLPSDVPLPVGFQDQLFPRLVDANNQTIPTTPGSFVWTSETPTIASIEQNGVFTALSAGSAVLRATASDGTTSTITLPTQVAVAGTTAVYGSNAEFGEPTDADPSDDYIVRYPQYTTSYNVNRGTPNWVAYDLEATHFGAEDRCDCFTMDAALPATFPQLTTADYTDGGYDRGHMARSFDRTTGSLDNARTYLFDNIVPQAGDLNQGPWAIFENFLGDEARFNNREVYIITGVAGNKGTLKNEGKVVIPTSTWKVAVIMPRDQGLADIHDYRDLEVIAVQMPNESGVRNVDWHTYITTVDAVEASSGYDLLALLPDDVENAVESNTQPPIAALTGPANLNEGDGATFSAASSVDPNGSILSYDWDFGDGSTGSGVSAAHVFTQDGVYAVSVTVTDNDGLSDTETITVTVSNIAPTLGSIPDASLQAGSAYTVAGSFSDPGADAWIATVDWGDGSSPGQAMLSGHDFSLVHVYATAGTFTVTVTIADDDTTSSTTHTVTVTAPPPQASLSAAYPLINQLVTTGKISRDLGNVLKAEIAAAQAYLDRGRIAAAVLLLRATVVELDLLVRLRVLAPADAAPLRTLLLQVIGDQTR